MSEMWYRWMLKRDLFKGNIIVSSAGGWPFSGKRLSGGARLQSMRTNADSWFRVITSDVADMTFVTFPPRFTESSRYTHWVWLQWEFRVNAWKKALLNEFKLLKPSCMHILWRYNSCYWHFVRLEAMEVAPSSIVMWADREFFYRI